MSSKIPPFQPPSPFIPFLRRFTDERARDLSETIELYNEVNAAHRASLWSQEDAIDRVNGFVADWIGKVVSLPESPVILKALDHCQKAVIALETTIFTFPKIDWDIATLSLKEQVDLRRFLRAQQHFLGNDDRVSDLLTTALGNVFGGLISELPAIPETTDDLTLTVPLVTLMRDPGGTVDKIIGTLLKEELVDAGLFRTLQEHLYENTCTASGVLPDKEQRKPFITADDSELPPIELVETYLKGTPFVDLLLAPVPFHIPMSARFQHQWIVAPPGTGKSLSLSISSIKTFYPTADICDSPKRDSPSKSGSTIPPISALSIECCDGVVINTAPACSLSEQKDNVLRVYVIRTGDSLHLFVDVRIQSKETSREHDNYRQDNDWCFLYFI